MQFGSKPQNLVGAILFVLYILAALFLTGLILFTLYQTDSNRSFKSVRSRNARILFASIATLSFSTLSYHMLHFLFRSYHSWSAEHGLKRPSSLIAAIRGEDFYPWYWASTSTLFSDFANELCMDFSEYWWTCLELLWSFQVSLFMTVEGASSMATLDLQC